MGVTTWTRTEPHEPVVSMLARTLACNFVVWSGIMACAVIANAGLLIGLLRWTTILE
jgi:hypothetical protein